ncbi:aminoglycoside phosphotransferase family protein [Chachezhania antarctica]|uniref:aminoglycoside phosphotransferase family protein n=1 Tax=Chachezhania antarctica TaxID=2340860 RepID=UPI000EADA8F0|nr:phosphotransferase [Chachezhania antarctica]|tara:strand:+ start:578 stop:1579 length:1002 start_codon:yes stop_codon:yes gene_type:complete
MTDRQTRKTAFIDAAGWGQARVAPLAGDASNRRYDRLTAPDGTTAVLMDAPPDRGEDIRPFTAIARHLQDCGLTAPAILAEDADNGFLLLEDLGDTLFARVLETDPNPEPQLYDAAIDVLVTLHAHEVPDVAPYDAPLMADLAALAFTKYRAGVLGEDDETLTQRFRDRFEDLLQPLSRAKPALALRDYHAENLIWLPERDGAARVGLLDFQDAMTCHPAYDIVSLLQDARRDVSPAIEHKMIARYIEATDHDSHAFHTAYALLGAQRNLRILGVFARLATDYGKPKYLHLIPRVWDHAMRDLDHPALAPIAELVHDSLPDPTPDTLAKLERP